MTLHLDRSGQLMARADIPSIGRTFDDVIHILVPTASLSTLEQGLATAKSRSNRMLRQTFQTGDAATTRELGKIPERLAEAERCLEAAKGGDDDAGQRLRRILLEIEGVIDSVEDHQPAARSLFSRHRGGATAELWIRHSLMEAYSGKAANFLRRHLHNPFWVLDLPVHATAEDVERKGELLLSMLALGMAEATKFHTPLGLEERTPELVREALAELINPDQRLLHEWWLGKQGA